MSDHQGHDNQDVSSPMLRSLDGHRYLLHGLSDINDRANLVDEGSGMPKPIDHDELDGSKAKGCGNQRFAWLNSPSLAPWAFELLACLLSLGAMAATVVTLKTHDGLPLPKWPLGISINALVSIYTILLKGGVMVAVPACMEYPNNHSERVV